MFNNIPQAYIDRKINFVTTHKLNIYKQFIGMKICSQIIGEYGNVREGVSLIDNSKAIKWEGRLVQKRCTRQVSGC